MPHRSRHRCPWCRSVSLSYISCRLRHRLRRGYVLGAPGRPLNAFVEALRRQTARPAVRWALVGLAYAEGYRGFQKRFSPRVVARAAWLARTRQPAWRIVAAPLLTMGLIHASPRRLIATWLLVAAIVGLILLVSLLDQPWRGAVDAGVVVGLSWGSATLLLELVGLLRGRAPTIDPDLPG